MKKFLIVSVALLLAGCVAYPANYDGYYYPYTYPYGYYGYAEPDVGLFFPGPRRFHDDDHDFHGGEHRGGERR